MWSLQEVCPEWHFSASQLDLLSVHCLSWEPDILSSAAHDWYDYTNPNFFFFNIHSIKNDNIFNCPPVFTDNWDFRKESYFYYLGDPLYFEVSATILHHFPLRVYVDHCVATATPDVDAPVRYDFIEHSG